MLAERMKIFEEGFGAIKESMEMLLRQSDAKIVLLIDKDGRLITTAGDIGGLDLASFASLSAADFSATSQIAMLIGEEDFDTLYHQGKRQHLYFTTITEGIILAIIFDEKTTLGLVRVRIKNTKEELRKIFDTVFTKERERESAAATTPPNMEDISKEIEDELDKLFG